MHIFVKVVLLAVAVMAKPPAERIPLPGRLRDTITQDSSPDSHWTVSQQAQEVLEVAAEMEQHPVSGRRWCLGVSVGFVCVGLGGGRRHAVLLEHLPGDDEALLRAEEHDLEARDWQDAQLDERSMAEAEEEVLAVAEEMETAPAVGRRWCVGVSVGWVCVGIGGKRQAVVVEHLPEDDDAEDDEALLRDEELPEARVARSEEYVVRDADEEEAGGRGWFFTYYKCKKCWNGGTLNDNGKCSCSKGYWGRCCWLKKF